MRPKHIRLITLRVSNLIPITLLSSKPSRFRDIFDSLLSKYYSLRKGKSPCAKAVAFVPPATSLFDSAIYPIIQYGENFWGKINTFACRFIFSAEFARIKKTLEINLGSFYLRIGMSFVNMRGYSTCLSYYLDQRLSKFFVFAFLISFSQRNVLHTAPVFRPTMRILIKRSQRNINLR